ADGVVETHLVRGHENGVEGRADAGAKLRQHRLLPYPRLLVTQKRRAVADGDHVVVEDAGVDRIGILLRENRARRVETVATRDGGGSLPRLPRREFLRGGPLVIVRAAARPEGLDSGGAGG